MAKKDETVPEDLLWHLRKSVPGFGAESADHQWQLARMYWLGGIKRRQHHHFDGAMSFSYKELDSAFGRGKFNAINDRLGFFKQSDNWSMSDGWTRGYWFSDLVHESRDRYLNLKYKKVTRLLMADGAALKTIPAAVASQGMDGMTVKAWKSAKELKSVRVDLVMLGRLRQWLGHIRDEWKKGRAPTDLFTPYPPLAVIERLVNLTAQVIRLSKIDVTGHGYIAQRYVMATSGRLYAKDVNLQTCHTLIKQAALSGLWEYDFSNCHFAIMEQMAAPHGHQCDAIASYRATKKETRAAIAEQAGITVDQAKVCLLAIMYGAKASERLENAIPDAIGQDAARRLYQVELFNGIKADIARARAVILKNWKRTANGSLSNAMGKAIAGSAPPIEQIAHLIQGVEAKALMTAVDMYPNSIVLLQHDGFASIDKLNSAAIMEAVFQATGYRLELEEDVIRVDPDAQFLKNRIKSEIGR